MKSPQIPDTKKAKPKLRLDFLCIEEPYARNIKVRLITSELMPPKSQCEPTVSSIHDQALSDCDCDC